MREYFPINDFRLKSIIEEFQKKKMEFNEKTLIELLEDQNASKYWKWLAAIGLRECGTQACLPSLKKAVDYPNEDVKNTAILTISHLAGEEELPYLISLLENKKLKKDYVLWAISAVDKPEALNNIVKYLSEKLKIDQRASSKSNSRVEYGLVYLDHQNNGNENAINILEGYKNLWNKFNTSEQLVLKNKTKFFKNY